jgi:hypothetical protein
VQLLRGLITTVYPLQSGNFRAILQNGRGSWKEAHKLLPHVHLADSLLERWLNGMHQRMVSPKSWGNQKKVQTEVCASISLRQNVAK